MTDQAWRWEDLYDRIGDDLFWSWWEHDIGTPVRAEGWGRLLWVHQADKRVDVSLDHETEEETRVSLEWRRGNWHRVHHRATSGA